MKSVEFTEEQLSNLQAIGKNLFGDEHDPRSQFYVRKLERPEINWGLIVVHTGLPFLLLLIVYEVLCKFGVSMIVSLTIPCVLLVVYAILMVKKLVVCLIKIYQRYAPASVRNKCRFEPSCSEYMLLVIEKYGLAKGIRQGMKRLRRCNVNGGGIDFP